MPRNLRRPPGRPRRLPRNFRRHGAASRRGATGKSGWDKAAVIVQAIGALAIFVSLGGLFIGIRQFNEQQASNAATEVNQQDQSILEEYLDDMSSLILTDHLAEPGSSATVRALALARTATAVRDLDGGRKGTLVRFLWESGLIDGPHPILDLYQDDLDNADFAIANLYQIDLSDVGLTGADFADARLLGANLEDSVLVQADLQGADLACYNGTACTDLAHAYLMRANLTGANLSDADLDDSYLEGANLRSADLTGAQLAGASYNTKPIQVLNAQGQTVIDTPTRWPAGFNPKAVGATCEYC